MTICMGAEMKEDIKNKLHRWIWGFTKKHQILTNIVWLLILYGYMKFPWTMIGEKSFKIFLLKAVVVNVMLILFTWVVYRCFVYMCFRNFEVQRLMDEPDEKEDDEADVLLEEDSSETPKNGLIDMIIEEARTDDILRLYLGIFIFVAKLLISAIILLVVNKAIHTILALFC